MSTAFYKMILCSLPYPSRHSFHSMMCFYKVFISIFEPLRTVCAQNIAAKLTYEYGRFFSVNKATSSLFRKHRSLPCELWVNNVIQCLQTVPLHHLLILNGSEVTNLLLEIDNRNVNLETPVTALRIYGHELTNNPFRGMIQPSRGTIQPFRVIILPFQGIILPFREIIQPF